MLARDTKAPPKPKADKAAPPKPTGPHVTIEGIGVIPLESFQWGSHHGPGGHGGGQPQVTEMQLSSKIGPHSNDLFRATLSGEPHDAEIVYPTKDGEPRIKLKGAIVSSYSMSGEARTRWRVGAPTSRASRSRGPGTARPGRTTSGPGTSASATRADGSAPRRP